jgi:hypothetical protein
LIVEYISKIITNEINDVVQISRPQKLPLACPEALTRVENIAFEQLAHFTQLGDYVRDLQADERICDVAALKTSSSEEMFKLSLFSMISIVSMSMSKNTSSSVKVLNSPQTASIVLGQ